MTNKYMTPNEALAAQMGMLQDVFEHNQLAQAGMFEKALEIVVPKRHDYSSGEDPLANLRQAELLDLAAEIGVAIRLLDKQSRLKALSTEEAQVKDEGVMDTIVDIINYACIYGLLYMENRTELLHQFLLRGKQLPALAASVDRGDPRFIASLRNAIIEAKELEIQRLQEKLDHIETLADELSENDYFAEAIRRTVAEK